jgi:hypothetical protein
MSDQTITIQVPITIDLTTLAAAVAAILAPAPAPVPTPAPPPTGLPTGEALVLSAGALNKAFWPGDWSYGGPTLAYGALDPTGVRCLKVTAQMTGIPPGGGGWQPYFVLPGQTAAGGLSTALFTHLVVNLKPTRAGQTWLSAVKGAGDVAVPGSVAVNIEAFGPAPQVGVWGTYKIPLGASGYNLGGALIEKFMVQDQMPWTDAATSAGNEYYIGDAYFV